MCSKAAKPRPRIVVATVDHGLRAESREEAKWVGAQSRKLGFTHELLVWEVFGNVKWATGCLTQSRRHLNGQDRSVEYAVLGRMAAEMEYELLDLIEKAA